jgi:hypothetical protein
MTERIIQLAQKGNQYALRGVAAAKRLGVPDSRMANSIWKLGEVYMVVNIASPPPE